MIPKFCHNIECRYVCISNPEEDCYAEYDVECPACGDEKSLRSYMPEFLITKLVKSWWKEHRLQK